MTKTISINKYLPIAILYFFLNSFLLPSGLLYTTLLTPLLLLWLFKYPSFKYTGYFLLLTAPFIIIHFISGVHYGYYIKSYLLLFSAVIFGICFYQYLKNSNSLRRIFRFILVTNIILVFIACIAWFFPGIRPVFWLTSSVSRGLESLSRLKLLTYEPSYYSTLLVPLAFYYYLKIIFLKLPNTRAIVFFITLPLLLSFSLGILLGIPLTIALLFLFNLESFLTNKKTRRWILLGLLLTGVSLVTLIIVYPDNPLFIRIKNILEGRDTSFSGRTFDAFYLAWEVIKTKSVLFGVGLGQAKVQGLEIWNSFYNHKFAVSEIAIPCAVADTMAAFGIVGVVIRIAAEIYLFFRTKVYSNYYRYALFIFIFIYQFTGSYINNIAEFTLWILAYG